MRGSRVKELLEPGWSYGSSRTRKWVCCVCRSRNSRLRTSQAEESHGVGRVAWSRGAVEMAFICLISMLNSCPTRPGTFRTSDVPGVVTASSASWEMLSSLLQQWTSAPPGNNRLQPKTLTRVSDSRFVKTVLSIYYTLCIVTGRNERAACIVSPFFYSVLPS